jgi:succinate-acetate transporter protein
MSFVVIIAGNESSYKFISHQILRFFLIENSIFTIEMSLCRLVLRLKILFFLIRFIMFRLMFFGFKSEIEKLLEILSGIVNRGLRFVLM